MGLKIISDGTTIGTSVEYNGMKLGFVSKVEIDPIDCKDSLVTAKVTFVKVQLDADINKISELKEIEL